MALDVSPSKIGIATSVPYVNAHVVSLQPTISLHERGYSETAELLQNLFLHRKITDLVIGEPLLPSGARGAQCDVVADVWGRIRAESTLDAFLVAPVHYFDERCTTAVSNAEIAEEIAAEDAVGKFGRRGRKKMSRRQKDALVSQKDSYAARNILETYLYLHNDEYLEIVRE